MNINKVYSAAFKLGVFTNQEIAYELGISTSNASNYLSKLKKSGKIKAIGQDGPRIIYKFKGEE